MVEIFSILEGSVTVTYDAEEVTATAGAGLTPEQFADSAAMDRLGQKYDIWTAEQ